MKDMIVSKALKSLFASYASDFGTVLDCSLDSRASSLSLDVLLKGEDDPVRIDVGRYEIISDNGRKAIRFHDVNASREWMNELLNRYGQREFDLPEQLPSGVLKMLIGGS